MTNLWINEYQNWNALYTPYISHSFECKRFFCCMRCDTRTGLFNFWNFPCRKRAKKGPFAALSFESCKNFVLTYRFQETNIILFTSYQRYFIGQNLRENFVPMRNALGPLLQRSLLTMKTIKLIYFLDSSAVALEATLFVFLAWLLSLPLLIN